MNNLKKVLALGLALIMLLGMFTVVSAAKDDKMVASDLTDWDSVNHQDAVALMVDLGVINGLLDGSFAPTGNIDRASWAKMVYYAKTGSNDADAYLGTATGLNDIAGNWAESYISYLKANNYVSGDNYGNYNPSNNVTVAEACKMMLTCLGYDADDRGYQNNATWSGNIMNDARRYGLMDDVDRTQTALVPLTRENAAQIVYNAMKANTVLTSVQWDGGVKHVTGYTKDQTLGFEAFGIVPVEVTVKDIDPNGNATVAVINDVTVAGIQLGNVNNKVKASRSMVGENVIIWCEVTKANYDEKTGELTSISGFNKVISSTVAKSNSAADYVFTQGFRWADLTTAGKANKIADKFVGGDGKGAMNANSLGNVQVYINGIENGGKASNVAAVTDVLAKVTYGENQNTKDDEVPGTVVEFYLNEQGEIAVIRAYIYNVAQLEGDVETRTSNGIQQVRLPGVSAGNVNLNTWKNADKVTGWQGLKEKDVVLFYAGGEGDATTYVIEKADKVTGVVTGANSSGQITVNGTKYKRTGMDKAVGFGVGVSTPDGKINNQADFSNWYNTEDEFAFYLDKTGCVCFTEQITETMSKSNIALVLAAEWGGTSMSVATGKLQAKLLFMDGTQQIVDVSKVNGLDVVTAESTNASTAEKQVMGAPKGSGNVTALKDLDATSYTSGETTKTYAIAALLTPVVDNDDLSKAAFFNYRVVNGKYELEEVEGVKGASTEDDWAEPANFTAAHIEKKADFSNGKTDWKADSKTVFLVAKGEGDDKTYYTYTSYKNVPEMKSAAGLAVGTGESGAAKYVYLTTEAYSDDVPDGYIFIINNKWENDPNNENAYLINIVDTTGNVTTMSVDKTIATNVRASTNAIENGYLPGGANQMVGYFWTVDEIDENGVVSKLTRATDVEASIDALGNEVVNDYAYDNVTKFVYVDMQVEESDGADRSKDTIVFSGAGTFNPNTFYKTGEIDNEHTPGVDSSSSATKSFHNIQMWIIPDGKEEMADYVYVLRVLW